MAECSLFLLNLAVFGSFRQLFSAIKHQKPTVFYLISKKHLQFKDVLVVKKIVFIVAPLRLIIDSQ